MDFEWSFDSNIRKTARRTGMRMLESDHSLPEKREGYFCSARSRLLSASKACQVACSDTRVHGVFIPGREDFIPPGYGVNPTLVQSGAES